MSNADLPPLDPRVWRIAAVVIFGPLLANLDATVVNVSLTTLGRELAAPLVVIQWVVSGYLLSLALALPLTGWLVDRIGAKRVYLYCFTAFLAASTLCGFAQSASMLITARVAQGLAGGLLAPMAQMMIARHAGPHMARVMGVAGIPASLGPLLGPVLAGLILQQASWRWIFFINVPVSLAAIGLALAFLPKDVKAAPRRLDLVGLAIISAGLVFLLNGASGVAQAHTVHWTGWLQVGAGLILLAAFGVYSASSPAPLLDLRLLLRKTVATAAGLQFLSNAVGIGGQFLLPIYYLVVRGEPAARTGLLLTPMGLGLLVTFPLVGRITHRFEPRLLVFCGAMLTLAGTLPFAIFGGGLPEPAAAAAMFIRSIGYGAMVLPTLSAAYAFIAPSEIAVATTTLNVLQRIAGPIATTTLALVLQAFAPAGGGYASVGVTPAGVSAAFWCLCVLTGGSALLSLRLIGRPAAVDPALVETG